MIWKKLGNYRNELSVSKDEITLANLQDDLGADSLDAVELIMTLKKNLILQFR